ncbi:MAG TPA: glycosyltransferase family 2 protein [Gaiellaceae bacterium]|nr:glycosyltransferase family 2 protein [Gaiellaceae bacterium]
MSRVDVTWLGYFMAAVSLYYVVLFVLSLRIFARRDPYPGPRPGMALIIPAHNEEAVISETLESLVRLEYDSYALIVVNDGSTDATGERARAFESTGRVLVVDRPPEEAGRGKGAVLNEGYRVLGRLLEQGDPLVADFGGDVVIGVIDADGLLEPNALAEVARLFADPRVAGVQMGVIIGNAHEGLIERCQDLEFVGFSHLAQAARDRIGSVGLGGNGQFTRLAALQSLGRPPWTDCLTEDLDLGLNLTQLGWKIRYCRTTSVTQQGVRTVRAWLRQRTRWAQGHYQCWHHVPKLLSATDVPLATRLDLSLYLLFVAFVMFVAANLAIAAAGAMGAIWVSNEFLSFIPPGPPRNITMEVIGLGPVVMLLTRYQQHSPHPLRWWELPAYGAAFGLYVYLWTLASVVAWFRLVAGRVGWAKTRRVSEEVASR